MNTTLNIEYWNINVNGDCDSTRGWYQQPCEIQFEIVKLHVAQENTLAHTTVKVTH